MNVPVWAIVLTAICQVLSLLVTALLTQYVQQKGKNQADKEDLEEITTIVESVKRLNTEELEYLKTNLSLLTSRKNAIFTEEKEAIIQFNAKLNTWFWEALAISLIDYNHTNYKGLSDRMIKLTDNYNQTNVALSKVELLIKDADLIVKAHACVTETLKLHQFLENLMRSLERNLSSERMYVEQFLGDGIKKMKETPEVASFIGERAKELGKEKKEITQKYLNDRNSIASPVHTKKKEFMESAKEYLNQLQ